MRSSRSTAGLSYVEGELQFVEMHEAQTPTSSVFYIIDAEWFRRWAKYVKHTGPKPGPISNARLLQSFDRPKPNLKVARDYRGVSEAVWEFLQQRHGGGPEIRAPYMDIYRLDVTVGEPLGAAPSSSSDESSSGSGSSPQAVKAQKASLFSALRMFATSPAPKKTKPAVQHDHGSTSGSVDTSMRERRTQVPSGACCLEAGSPTSPGHKTIIV
mmetsp:Transcript_48979/g.90317  ORF Transcript_48979/g.90317 Transcript_48979/m.90317 type:complete len:213 (-) Transcript_48979:410-1048(-)